MRKLYINFETAALGATCHKNYSTVDDSHLPLRMCHSRHLGANTKHNARDSELLYCESGIVGEVTHAWHRCTFAWVKS